MMNRGIPKYRNKAWMNNRCLVRYLIAAYLIGYGMDIIADKYWLYYVPLPIPTLVEMKKSRSCDVIFSSQRPLYSEDDWQYLRDLWSSQQQERTNYKIVKTKTKNNNNTKTSYHHNSIKTNNRWKG